MENIEGVIEAFKITEDVQGLVAKLKAFEAEPSTYGS